MTIKDAFQFGIEPVRISDTDNIQINEGLPTNADPQVYALQLAKTVKAMLNGVLKDAQENIPFPVEVLPTRNSLPTPIIAHTLADRSVVVPVRGGISPDIIADFRALSFADASFSMVVLDPPHLERVGDNAWMGKKYGRLNKDAWRDDLRQRFKEAFRVLRPHGVLIF